MSLISDWLNMLCDQVRNRKRVFLPGELPSVNIIIQQIYIFTCYTGQRLPGFIPSSPLHFYPSVSLTFNVISNDSNNFVNILLFNLGIWGLIPWLLLWFNIGTDAPLQKEKKYVLLKLTKLAFIPILMEIHVVIPVNFNNLLGHTNYILRMTYPDRLCYVMSEEKKIKIVCPALVGGKKKIYVKVDHVIECSEHF